MFTLSRRSASARALVAVFALLATTRALVAPPCEHHAGAGAFAPGELSPTKPLRVQGAGDAHAAHGPSAPGQRAHAHVAPTEAERSALTDHEGRNAPSHAAHCTCVGACAARAPISSAPVRGVEAIVTESRGEARLTTLVARIPDRAPFALPWSTAPPA